MHPRPTCHHIIILASRLFLGWFHAQCIHQKSSFQSYFSAVNSIPLCLARVSHRLLELPGNLELVSFTESHIYGRSQLLSSLSESGLRKSDRRFSPIIPTYRSTMLFDVTPALKVVPQSLVYPNCSVLTPHQSRLPREPYGPPTSRSMIQAQVTIQPMLGANQLPLQGFAATCSFLARAHLSPTA